MRSGKRSIIEPISPIIIPEVRSYWATHFYSMLNCLDKHKNIQYSPMKLAGYPYWSLAVLRGTQPVNFFNSIEQYIKNWGVQYLLVSFFNQKLGGHIITELLERLEDLYNVCFSKNLDTFSFYVSGADSSLSHNLKDNYTTTFPKITESYHSDTLIANSDLCLIVDSSFGNEKVAIFGEVEGIYGNKLRNESYWTQKNNLCVFGVGVIDGVNRGVYFQENHFSGIPRVQLLFERSHYLISDFMTVLNAFSQLFLIGPTCKSPLMNDEFEFFFQYLCNNWSSPIEDIFKFLEKFIDNNDLVGINDKGLEIITDLHA